MPMGIISDDELLKELKRVGSDKSSLPDSDDIPRALPDTAIPISEEISDYEPKESGNIGLEMRSMGSSDGTDEAEDKDIDKRAVIHPIQKGRPEGRNNRTDEERKVIAGEALLNGNQSAMLRFGVSQSSVSAYKNGATSTASYDRSDDELLKEVTNQRIKIAGRAHSKLSEALDHITSEKLAGANLRTIASVATAMSAVIKNIEPDQSNQTNNNIQFTFYAPKQRSESQFDIIDMQDE